MRPWGLKLEKGGLATYDAARTRAIREDPNLRVLRLDLKLSAQDHEITAATRIFFVNPVWNKAMEAQAIKRAHRTGQTRPVHVEILVLQDTLEHAMLRRRDRMTRTAAQAMIDSPADDDCSPSGIFNAEATAETNEEISQETH